MSGRRGRGFDLKAGFRKAAAEPSTGVHPAMLKQARKSGQLNLSNRQLTEVPDSVWRINIDVPEEAQTVSLDNSEDRWWEQTDLTKLILASNALIRITDDIQQLPALTVLDVHDNQLESLPEAIGQLVNLQKLVVSHNKLTSLPSSLKGLAELQSFHMEHNHISELGDGIGRLYNLEDLDVSNNWLTGLPGTIGYLTRLIKFNVSNNKIKELPSEMGSMDMLRMFDATNNSLNRLPDEMGYLRHLEQLYLRHNQLTHIPVLFGCKAIKELHLGNNNIQGLTVEHLKHLSAISVLDLRDNKISQLPDEITLLEKLERIDLTNNNLSGLPFVLGTLTKLKSIVLDGNPMKGIRRDIIMRGTNELKKYLVSRMEAPEDIDRSAVKATQGTSGIIGGGEGLDAHAVTSTKSLDYSNKKATEIPSDVWELASKSQITKVNFSKNTLNEWPQNLASMSESLNELNLGWNKLNQLSPDLGQFLNLIVLDLRNNLLSDLPDSMNSLKNLRDLTISVNRFKVMPAVVFELSNLENLLASDNQIGQIDADRVKRLPMLATLDLQNNDLMQVPPELGNCASLRSLQLGGNPFRQPRPAILAKGTPALLEYLRSRIPT